MEITDILREGVGRGASDILLVPGLPVAYKTGGSIVREGARLPPSAVQALTESVYALSGRAITRLSETGDDDFSFGMRELARFRVNAFRQRGSLSMVIRIVSFELPDAGELGIPESVLSFASAVRGLVLFTGPAGSGKSTTLSCIVDRINKTRNGHIITIEDPIEFLHQHKKSIVTQRELLLDTRSYESALRAALREAPDVILVGEMRDAETIRAAMTAAETGHLVISTLHTLGAANTIDRIIDIFDPQQQNQIRTQLSMVLEGVVSQQLMRDTSGALVPAFEVLTMTGAVRNIVRESKVHQLDNIIATSSIHGMVSMDQAILSLYKEGRILREEALRRCMDETTMYKKLAVVSRSPQEDRGK